MDSKLDDGQAGIRCLRRNIHARSSRGGMRQVDQTSATTKWRPLFDDKLGSLGKSNWHTPTSDTSATLISLGVQAAFGLRQTAPPAGTLVLPAEDAAAVHGQQPMLGYP